MSKPESAPMLASHYSVVVVGGGQAGLSMSYYLKQMEVDHAVLEKYRVAHEWRRCFDEWGYPTS